MLKIRHQEDSQKLTDIKKIDDCLIQLIMTDFKESVDQNYNNSQLVVLKSVNFVQPLINFIKNKDN